MISRRKRNHLIRHIIGTVIAWYDCIMTDIFGQCPEMYPIGENYKSFCVRCKFHIGKHKDSVGEWKE